MTTLVEHRRHLSDVLARQAARRRVADPSHRYAQQPLLSHEHRPIYPQVEAGPSSTGKGKAVPSPSGPSKDNVVNYIAAEEAVRNDSAAWYGVSGEFPSNFVLGAGDAEICEEFPALRRLMDLKAEHVDAISHPPLFLPLESPSPGTVLPALSPHRFDVILIHPLRSWAETAALPIRQLSADPGFVFLWVGSGDAGGLERGRECLAKWGFRRAEDIVWVKTNKKGATTNGGGLFASQKEHCLMGIRGTVRRSTDSRFVHCNVDTDVIVWESEEGGPRTPPYLYTLVENFCLGARRLELFGSPERARRGWVTASVASPPEDMAIFDSPSYPSLLPLKEEGKPLLPFHAEIDLLRPKSPQRRGRPAPPGPQRGGRPNMHGTASPPPSQTPPYRQGGVIRMGSLTPAQGYQQQMNPAMFQHPGHGMPMAMAQNMAMGGMMPMMAHGMQGGMGMHGMPAMMSMPFAQGMGMMQGGMGGMPMAMGMGMGGMGMGGMGMGMGMGGMGVPGMGMMPMMPGVGGSPQMEGSPQMMQGQMMEGGDDVDWSAHIQAQQAQFHGQGQHGHAHTMGQLAMGMGAMGMPYLGGGYQYSG